MGFNGSSRVAPGGPAKSFGNFFLAGEFFYVLAGFFFKKIPPGAAWREKIFFLDPGFSRLDPTRLAKHQKFRSRRKKRRGLVGTHLLVMSCQF